MRDTHKAASWFDEAAHFTQLNIQQSLEIKKRPTANLTYEPVFIRNIAMNHAKLMLCRYSRGDAVAGLAPYFEPLLQYWEESTSLGRKVWSPAHRYAHTAWAVNLDHYIECFWLVGLALALRIPDAQWQRLVALVGNEGEDALLDRIIATRQSGRRIGATLCYPKPYWRLLAALDAPATQRKVHLRSFVARWFSELANVPITGRPRSGRTHQKPYWHGYHRLQGDYFGYWCLEAVAAVAAFQLDDSLCKDSPHYPGELLSGAAQPRAVERRAPVLNSRPMRLERRTAWRPSMPGGL